MSTATSPVRVVGRYALHGVLASGGMATVHVGRLMGPVGFSRTVAIKRLHPQYASDPEFVTMFLDEARLAGRIRHPNAVPVIDVVEADGEVLLVMEYVQGETLARLLRRATEMGEKPPPDVTAAIVADTLEGLHAVHEARDERGQPLGIVHRDVSPQNVMVGIDGVARVLDFGIAKAAGRSQVTREGQLKGKLAYMAPEQLHGEVSRLTDVFAAGIVLWEALTAKRLFHGSNEGETVTRILAGKIEAPSEHGAPPEYDAVVLKALAKDPKERFQSAREMAVALVKVRPPADPPAVGAWVERIGKDLLDLRAELISGVEAAPSLPQLPASAPSIPEIPVDATQADLTRDNVHRSRRRPMWMFAVAGVGLVVVAVGATLAITSSQGGGTPAGRVVASATATAPAPPTTDTATAPVPSASVATTSAALPSARPTATVGPGTTKPHVTATASTKPVATATAKPTQTIPDHI